jgi:histidinol-phosphate phosphatase family protein
MAVQERVVDLFAEEGVRFDAAYFCFHAPTEGCTCRKPAPGMLIRAARDLGLDLRASIMIGDKSSDIAAGTAAGAISIGLGDTPFPGAEATVGTWQELSAWLCTRG